MKMNVPQPAMVQTWLKDDIGWFKAWPDLWKEIESEFKLHDQVIVVKTVEFIDTLGFHIIEKKRVNGKGLVSYFVAEVSPAGKFKWDVIMKDTPERMVPADVLTNYLWQLWPNPELKPMKELGPDDRSFV